MMNCQQVTRTVGDFLERRLRLRDRLAFLLHIAMCRGCRAYLEQLRLTLLALRSLPEPAAAPTGHESALRLFREESGRGTHER